jgi:spore germination protein GerM
MTRRLLLALVLLTALAACGVPTDDTPRALPAERVPFGLLETDPAGAPTGVPGAATRRSVYLVRDDRLVEVTKQVAAPGAAVDTLRELLMGPDAEDIEDGLVTRIPSGTVVNGVSGPVEGVATIDLSGDLSAAGEGLRLAFAQMVYTATGVPGVDRVLFAIDGQPRDVPDDQGQTTAEPLGRSDFAQFRPAG